MRRHRILHIIDKSTTGGGQHNVFTLASNHDRKHFAAVVACSPGGPLVERCREHGIDVRTITMTKRFNPVSMAKIRRLIRDRKIGLVHAHGLVATTFSLLPTKLAGVPMIYSQHGYHHHNYRGAITRPARIWTEKFLARRTRKVICDSAADRLYGEQNGYFDGVDCHTLPPAIDLSLMHADDEEVDALRRHLGLENVFPLLGTVGRLDAAKGYPDLLEALVMFRERHPATRFIFVGDGPERHDLEARVRRLDLEDTVMLLGRQEEIGPFLRLYDVFVSSSHWEGLPVAVSEAMAMECPVVATRVGGSAELVQDGETGLLVPAKDPRALADALSEIIADRERLARFGKSGRDRIKEHFSVTAVVPRLESLYRQILEAEGSR